MIKVENITKEFKSNKKYPGFKGAIKSFFSTEYIIKKAVDDISFSIEDGEIQPKVEPIFMSNKGEYDRWPKGFMDQSQINYYNLQKYRRDEIK